MTAATVLEKAGTQPLVTDIDRSQATVAEWVATHPIFEVCDRETSDEGGRSHQDPWWRQTTAIKQLNDTLKEILAAARDCHWKSGRRGEIGEGDRDAEESEDGAVSDGY